MFETEFDRAYRAILRGARIVSYNPTTNDIVVFYMSDKFRIVFEFKDSVFSHTFMFIALKSFMESYFEVDKVIVVGVL